jgi:electron transfer flavoprotein beta subunit
MLAACSVGRRQPSHRDQASSRRKKEGRSGIVVGSAQVVREVDGGLETLECGGCDRRSSTERSALCLAAGIMKARKKELKESPVADLGVDVAPKLKVHKLEPPPKRQAGRKVASVEELVQVLHNEAKVI